MAMLNQEPLLRAIGGLGPVELIIILVIVLLIFGAGKLPQIGGALGKSIRNFKKSSSGVEDEPEDVTPKAIEDKSDASARTVEVETETEKTKA